MNRSSLAGFHSLGDTINTNGSNFTVLHTFSGTDGENPNTPLTLFDNMLYGATTAGGSNNDGTVFAINLDGTGFTVLQNVALVGGLVDGFPSNPHGNLVVQSNTLFGTTTYSGISNAGTIFSLQLPVMPNATVQPQNLTVTVGHPASFSTSPYGSPPLSYQWLLNGTNILDATNSTFALSNAFPVNAGLYAVIVTNIYGCSTSAPAMLTVSPLVLTAPQLPANGELQFSFDTATGVNYAIQYSTTLTDWFPFVTFEGIGERITIIDPNAAGSSQRFYRIVLSPQSPP